MGEVSKKMVAMALMSVMLMALLTGCLQKADNVVAVIDGREITQEEFNRYIHANLTLYNQDNYTEVQMLEFLINEELFYNEALERGFEINQETIDAEYEEYKEFVLEIYFENNESSFTSKLKELKLDEEYLKERVIERNLVISDFAESLQQAVEPVTSADVEEFYNENIGEFTHDEMRGIRHILVDSKEVAQALLKRLNDGEDFEKLAEQYTIDQGSKKQGGAMPPMEAKRFVKPFADAAFALEVGEISEIVETEHGYHIIEVLGVEPPGVTPLDSELREDINVYLDNQKQAGAVDSLMIELRENANVEKKLG